jgi:hypothetical protein
MFKSNFSFRWIFGPVSAVVALLGCLVTALPAQDGDLPRTNTSAASATPLAPVVVEGRDPDRLIGPYLQPEWAARGRFTTDTDVYVLPPYEWYIDLDYQLTSPKHDAPSHLFTQEIEVGLPHRFQLAYENNVQFHHGRGQDTVQTIEVRYALADWGKIPLNPTLFAEYKFGVGHELGSPEHHDAEGDSEESAGSPANIPNGYEIRLLLGEQFGKRTQWALNIFNEQAVGGDRETETGFSQAINWAVYEDMVRAGLEMEFVRRTDSSTRSRPSYEFDVGPSFSYKTSSRTRFDVAALFGTTHDSPTVKLFAVFSINVGGESEHEIAAPVSTQNR